jgi:hypothetical protein
VFREAKPLSSGTPIREAGLKTWAAVALTSGAERDSELRAAQVRLTAAPLVARIGAEPAWFYYEDRGPYQAYQHAGRIALVGTRTGKVFVSKTMLWPPLVGRQLPTFLLDEKGYRDSGQRVFVRGWKLGDRATPPATSIADNLASRQKVADALAAERSCAVRISDALGNFYDRGPVDRTRAFFGEIFDGLARLNPGFVTDRYTIKAKTTPMNFVQRVISQKGCKDVFIYLAGGGYLSGEPAVNVGTRGRSDGRIEQIAVTASQLRALIQKNPSVTFKLKLDAPSSGAFLPRVAGLPNLLIFESSSHARQGSFIALSQIVGPSGRQAVNSGNPRQLIEFTNRQLYGIQTFINSSREVDNASNAKRSGKAPSFFAWMLARAYELGKVGDLSRLVIGAPDPQIQTFGFNACAPDCVERPPTADSKSARTNEDTPVSIVLSGSDPDGDPLSFSIASGPSNGTITGSGATRTYTPNADFSGSDSFTYTADDQRGGTATGTVSITVDPVNDAPTVTTSSGTATYTEGGAAVQVDPSLAVGDIDSTVASFASVTISGNFASGEDLLGFANQSGITGDFNAATGVLTLTGPATVSQYQAALRSVTFRNTSLNPSNATRTVSFRVSDGSDQSAPATRNVLMSTLNDAAILTAGGGTAAYTENGTGTAVDPALDVSDVDSTTFVGATASITGNLQSGEDRLDFTSPTGSGITATYDSGTGVLTLNGVATVADYRDALRSVAYRNTSDDPSTVTRTVSFRIDDGGNQNRFSNIVTSNVTVSPVNDAPTATAGGGSPSFTEGGSAVTVDPALTVGDVDDADIESATVQITGGLAAGEDDLDLTGPLPPGFSTNVLATDTITITGTGSKATYESLLRSVTYRNTNTDNPSTAPRQISFTVNDGALTSTPAAITTLTVVPVDDAPTLGGGAGSASYTEDDQTGVIVHSAITTADVDDTNLEGASAQITGNYAPGQDELLFSAQNGINGSFNPTTGTLTLIGSATKADYQTALRSIRYRDTNVGNPSTLTRTVSFQVTDGDLAGNVVLSDITVSPVNDAPAVTAGGGSPSFTEGGSPVAIDPAVQVSDVDSANLQSATVIISGNRVGSEDELVYPAVLHGIAGAYNSGSGVLTLTGTGSPSDYQDVLRSIQYRNTNTDNPGTAPRGIDFAVKDSAGADSANASTSLTVIPVNDAPTVDNSLGNASFTEDDTTGVIVDPAVTVADVDNANLAGATVQITTNRDSSEDELLFNTQNGITGNYVAGTGILTLSGSATKADYQTALRSIRYRDNDTGNPTTATRTVTFTVNDGTADSASDSRDVAVLAVNDAPALVAGGGPTPNFTEGDTTGVVVDSAITPSDVDNTDLAGATVKITGNYAAGEDLLTFANTANITGNLVGDTLTLTGTDTVGNYQAALRSIRYRNTSSAPSTAQRTVSFTVTDGALSSNTTTAKVDITPVNTAPTVTTSGGVTAYTEDGPPAAIDTGISVFDPDSADFNQAVVTISANYEAGFDQLDFANTPEITGNYAAGTLTLTGAATQAQYEAALKTVKFRTTSDTPSTAQRTISFTVRDSSNDSSAPAATKALSVAVANDPPALLAGGGTPSFTEGGSPVTVDPDLQVSDPDSANLQSATVCVCNNAHLGEDELVYPATLHGITGTYAPGTGILTLSGTASPGDYQDALRSIQYRNTNTVDPNPATRGIAFQATDTSAANSNIATTSLTVIGVNNAPVLGGGGNTVSYSEDDAATIVNGALTVTDDDDANIESATVAITSNLDTGEDELTFSNQSGISGAYNASTGVIALTGSATKAAYQTALRSIRYVNNDHVAPSTLNRTVSFTVNDGDVDSNTATTTITVTQLADAPVLTAGTGNTNTFTENGSPVAVDDAITVSDVDSTDLTGATVSITTGFSQAQGDTLNFATQNGISGNYVPSTGILTLSGMSTVANYETALRSITYSNTSESPTTSRTVSFSATDGIATSNTTTHGVTILPVNDAPTVTPSGSKLTNYIEQDSPTDPANASRPLDSAIAVDDLDNANLTGATVKLTTGLNSAQDVLAAITTGTSITATYTPATGTLALTGTDTKGNYQTVLRSVTYKNTSDTPSTAARTVEITATDGTDTSSIATWSFTVTPVNDAPTATGDTFTTTNSAVGNTTFVINDPVEAAPATPDPTDTAPAAAGRPNKTVNTGVRANDTDAEGSSNLLITGAGTDGSNGATTDGGTVTVAPNGHDLIFEPKASTSCTDHQDTFKYTVSDQDPGGAATAQATVTVDIANCVLYVNNDDAEGDAGTSEKPYDTLAQAEASSVANDTIFVYDGNDTTTGYDTGINLQSGQSLIGEAATLLVGGATLHTGDVANRPTLTDDNADVVALDDGNTVKGIEIDPQGTGGGIAGASGDTGGGTIDDVRIIDTGTAGTEPSFDLDSTTGTFNVSNLTINNTTATGQTSGSIGVRLNNNTTGPVNFLSSGQNSINVSGAAGLAAVNTNMGTGSTFHGIIVGGSGSGGVNMTGTTGTTIFGDGAGNDLSLTTTSSTTAAFGLSNAGTVTVGTAAGDSVHADGGPAISVSSTTITALDFDDVDSANSASNGISLSGLGTAQFSATSGDIGGATGTAFTLSGGSGTVSYAGTINDGGGDSASITNRTGGAVTMSGAINDGNDNGGGIIVSSNSGGSTTFSNSTKTLNTGTNTAVLFNGGDGHTLTFTSGGLNIDTAGGAGINAQGLNVSTPHNTLEITGSGNTIDTTTGRPLLVTNTNIGDADLTFQKIASNGAINGILLNGTGNANGKLFVQGNGGTCTSSVTCTGGAIQGSTQTGVSLTSVPGGVSFDRLFVGSSADDGINGASVSGFALNNSRVANNGNSTSDSGVELTQLSGTVGFNTTTVTASSFNNVSIINTSGSVTPTFTNGTYSETDDFPTSGADAILLRNDGSGTMNASVQGTTFTNNRDDHVNAAAGAAASGALNLTVNGTTMTDPVGGQGNGITVSAGGTASAFMELSLTNNDIQGSNQAAITVDGPGSAVSPQPANTDATITGNTIGTAAVSRSGAFSGVGIAVNSNGGADIDTLISGNTIRQYSNPEGLTLVQNDGVGSLNATVQTNVISNQANTINNLYGVRAIYGSDVSDTGAGCLDLGGAGALSNNLTGSSPGGSFDIRLRQAGPLVLKLPGYTGGIHDTAAVATYLTGRNTAPQGSDVSQPNGSATYINGAGCPLP